MELARDFRSLLSAHLRTFRRLSRARKLLRVHEEALLEGCTAEFRQQYCLLLVTRCDVLADRCRGLLDRIEHIGNIISSQGGLPSSLADPKE